MPPLFPKAPVTSKAQNGFAPVFTIMPAIARALMRIEAVRQTKNRVATGSPSPMRLW